MLYCNQRKGGMRNGTFNLWITDSIIQGNVDMLVLVMNARQNVLIKENGGKKRNDYV